MHMNIKALGVLAYGCIHARDIIRVSAGILFSKLEIERLLLFVISLFERTRIYKLN